MRRPPSSASFALAAATALAALLGLALPAAAAPSPTGSHAAVRNLIANGGFEEWGKLPAAVAARPQVRAVDLLPPGRAPRFWTPQCELYKGMGRTSTIALDKAVKHSGKRSVRITNCDGRDIAYVAYSTEPFADKPDDARSLRPNRHYLLRWWVRGKDVVSHGAGPIMMMFYTSRDSDSTWRTYTYEHGALPQGTFDWQRRSFTLVTGPHATWAQFTFQLRWATGTVWYDDVKLVDLGPVVPVETY